MPDVTMFPTRRWSVACTTDFLLSPRLLVLPRLLLPPPPFLLLLLLFLFLLPPLLCLELTDHHHHRCCCSLPSNRSLPTHTLTHRRPQTHQHTHSTRQTDSSNTWVLPDLRPLGSATGGPLSHTNTHTNTDTHHCSSLLLNTLSANYPFITTLFSLLRSLFDFPSIE